MPIEITPGKNRQGKKAYRIRIRKENISPATNHSNLCVLTKAIKWQKRIGITFNSFITDELKKGNYSAPSK